MLATVGHPHVVQLKDHGTTPDYVWLADARLPAGGDAGRSSFAERKRSLSPKQAFKNIFLPVRGLEALHEAGLGPGR